VEEVGLSEVVRLLLPVIALQVALQTYSLYLIARRSEWGLGTKVKWSVVVIALGVLGVLAFLFLGRRR